MDSIIHLCSKPACDIIRQQISVGDKFFEYTRVLASLNFLCGHPLCFVDHGVHIGHILQKKELPLTKNMRAMLTFRYLHNMTWSDIAKKSGEGDSPDAVKKRFERGLKAYEAQNTSVAYTEAEERALSWMKSVQQAPAQRSLGTIPLSSRLTGNKTSLKAGYGM